MHHPGKQPNIRPTITGRRERVVRARAERAAASMGVMGASTGANPRIRARVKVGRKGRNIRKGRKGNIHRGALDVMVKLAVQKVAKVTAKAGKGKAEVREVRAGVVNIHIHRGVRITVTNQGSCNALSMSKSLLSKQNPPYLPRDSSTYPDFGLFILFNYSFTY